MSSTTNRYGVHVQQRLPKRKRTIPLPGDLEDSGRYYRCWYCGFINNVQRNQVGDGDGVTQLDAPEIAMGGWGMDDPLSLAIILDDMFTLLQNRPDGNPITNYRHNNYPQIIGGCSLCGCKNYR
jgi:hypothetical protein